MPSMSLAVALRLTAARLEEGASYAWTHMGACNCGHLAQTLTGLSPAAIRAAAHEKRGDWAEQAHEYCGATGYAIDDVFEAMIAAGATVHEIADLERLGDERVLARAGLSRREVDRKRRDHVVRYMRAWASLLDERAGAAAPPGSAPPRAVPAAVAARDVVAARDALAARTADAPAERVAFAEAAE
jgi:hypothetical protein